MFEFMYLCDYIYIYFLVTLRLCLLPLLMRLLMGHISDSLSVTLLSLFGVDIVMEPITN